MLGQLHQLFLIRALSSNDGKKRQLLEELITVEKQPLSRELGKNQPHYRKEGSRKGRWLLMSHLILALTGSSFKGFDPSLLIAEITVSNI